MKWAVVFLFGCADVLGIEDLSGRDAGPETSLANLTVSAGVFAPAFAPGVTEYDLDLLLAEGSVWFTPDAVQPDATITVDGAVVLDENPSTPIVLAPGSRDVDVVLTYQGRATTYRLHVHRGVDALAALDPTQGTLTPTFDPAVTSYLVALPFDTPSVAVTPTLLVPGRGAVSVSGTQVPSATTSPTLPLAPGVNEVPVLVSPLTRPQRAYTVDIHRGDAVLASIALSYAGGPLPNRLQPAFDPATTSYNVDVGLYVQSVQVTATPIVPGATVRVSGIPVTSGQPSPAITLNLGTTSIPVVVTGTGGAETAYTLNITRAAEVLQEVYAKGHATAGHFGEAVALFGDTMVIGADLDDGAGADAGAVYVFVRTGTTWTQQAYLTASNPDAADYFGGWVALWGDTLAVGANREDSAAVGVNGDGSDNAMTDAGAVYVFVRSGTTWTQQAYIKASNPGASDEFGWGVSLWGDTLAVGARGESSGASGVNGNQNDDAATTAGAAYVFVRSGTTWTQQAYIKASNPDAFDRFGSRISLWGDTLAVGAIFEDSAGRGVQAVQADENATNAGAAYVFVRDGTTWTQQAYVKPSNTDPNDQFGRVALWGDTLAVGAPLEDGAGVGTVGDPDDNLAPDAGAVYLFVRSGTTWTQQAYVKASNTGAGDEFGTSVAVWGDALVAGAPFEDSEEIGVNPPQLGEAAAMAGAAYVFLRTGASWTHTTYLKASNTDPGDELGFRVAIWGDTVFASAHYEDSAGVGIGANQSNNTATNRGAGYLFR